MEIMNDLCSGLLDTSISELKTDRVIKNFYNIF